MGICAACGRESPDGFRHCGFCGAELVAPAVERRKLATLVFCDLSGSTALGERADPESVRAFMRAYFDAMRDVLEHHGGTVEKFIGDAVVAAFGVPTAHEDDALRACRAALEMQARFGELAGEWAPRFGDGVAIRIGVNTGEVVAGDTASRDTFVTGDAVNVAARLEQAAGAGEVLLGESTVRLLRDAVRVEERQPLDAKGKSEPLAAYRLLDVSDGRPTREGTPLAGRDAQLRQLEDTWVDVAARNECRLVTVLGEPGVGKSRLAAELAQRTGARVVRGTCLSYGEGITYWPIVQAIRELAGIGAEHAREEAIALLEQHVASREIVTLIAQLVGLAGGAATPAETAWAIRSFLAAAEPLVVVVDDLHCGEPLLLELLASLPGTPARILVVCLARPELLERHPDWHVDIRLEPLAEDDVAMLVDALAADAPADVRERLVRVSAGNPLFLEELVAALREDADTLPTSLHALLGARLDRLEPDSRDALERAAIEGELFHRGSVVALSTTKERVPGALADLGHREFVRPAQASFAGETAFRFKHVLVRDAAYRATAKTLRADLHEQFADWLERIAGARATEHEAIVGFHLEQSYRYRAELGLDAHALGARAARLLASAGNRAHARGDARAAASLYARAADVAPEPQDRAAHALRQGGALREALAFADAQELLARVRAEAAASGWAALEAGADIELATIEIHTNPGQSAERLRAAGERALPIFEAAGDDRGLALTLLLLARERWLALRLSEMEAILDRALPVAERAGDDRLVAEALRGLAQAAVFGPRPAAEAVERGEMLLARAREIGPMAGATIAMLLGVVEAAAGNAERARALAADSKAVMEEVSPGWMVAGAEMYAGLALLTGGDPHAAEAELRRAADFMTAHGERAVASTTVALRARALLELGRTEEAEHDARLALEWADPGDVVSQVYARGTLARVLAGPQALEHAHEAVALSAASDFLTQRGDTLVDLAAALEAAGDTDAARDALDEALDFYRAKGNVVALTLVSASPIMAAHPVKGETMSEHDPERPAPDAAEEEQSPETDFLFPETEKPEQDDSDE